jgi:hypothetical protein
MVKKMKMPTIGKNSLRKPLAYWSIVRAGFAEHYRLVLLTFIALMVALASWQYGAFKAKALSLQLAQVSAEQEQQRLAARLSKKLRLEKQTFNQTGEQLAQAQSRLSRLPAEDQLSAAPLERYFQVKGSKAAQLVQIDYRWPVNSATNRSSSRQNNAAGLPSDLQSRRLDVQLQMRGTYPGVRHWIGTLLIDLPNVQLSQLQIKRLTRETDQVAASVTLSLFYLAEVPTGLRTREGPAT